AERPGGLDGRERVGLARRDAGQHGLQPHPRPGGLRARAVPDGTVTAGTESEDGMDDYALVLNAGSSSLKFCVYRRPEVEGWRLEARGQIEGIGTSPRLAAKDDAGSVLADEKLGEGVRDGKGAIDALAAWLRSRYGGSRVLGVGHRVVHGGARFTGPTVV